MPNENVGDGRSVGQVEDYASKYGAIQQGLAHRFDQYTNPFMLSQSLSNVFQPGIQNAQKQQMVNIDQARQNMAQTAQDTLLPLQANSINAQTDEMKARVASMNYQLSTQQDAMSQFPDFMKSVGDAVQNNDPAALATSIGQYPAAVRLNPGLAMDAYNKISQSKQIETTGITGAAMANGADYVTMNPGSSVDDIKNSYTPSSPNLNPAQQIAEKNAYMQGATHNQVQITAAQVNATVKEAVAEMNQNGRIAAATQRSLGMLAAKGQVSPKTLAAMDVDPQTSSQLMAALNTPPDSKGLIIPDRVLVANINAAKSIEANPLSTTVEKNWAHDVMNNNGAPSFNIPTYAPAVQDKIDLLQGEINDRQKALEQNQKGWMWGASDTNDALGQITDLKKQLIDVKNNNAKPASSAVAPAAQSSVDIPTPTITFGTNSNPYLPSGGLSAIPGVTDIPDNPQTSAALQATTSMPTSTSFNPSAMPSQYAGIPQRKSTSVSPTQSTMSQSDIQVSPQQIQSAKEWLKNNPDDPRASGVRLKLRASGVRDI